jgi:hypothetical protein
MNFFYKTLFLFVWIIVLFACSQRNISSGRAIVAGRFADSSHVEQNTVVKLFVPDLILGTMAEHIKTLESNGSFVIEVPIINPLYATASVNSEENTELVVLLSPGSTTQLNLFLDETGKIRLRTVEGVVLKSKDWENIWKVNYKVMTAFAEGLNSPRFQLPVTPQKYADSMLIRMEKDLSPKYLKPIFF